MPKHCHDWPFVSFLIGGAYRSTSSRSDFDVDGLTALHFPPWYEHADAIGRSGARFFCVQFQPDALDGECGPTETARHAFRIGSETAMTALVRLFAAFVANQSELDIEARLWEFLSALYTPHLRTPSAAWVEGVCERLRAMPDEPPSLDQLATELGMHRATLARQFRRATGHSIGGYHRLVRRTTALDLLLTSRQPLSRIGQAAGYADQSHMTRDFASHFDCPPQRLRKRTAEHFQHK